MNDPILVVDLEATCSDDGAISAEEMETIEIGACWVAPDGSVLDRFQSFVCPVLNPRLTKFCSDLTHKIILMGMTKLPFKKEPF